MHERAPLLRRFDDAFPETAAKQPAPPVGGYVVGAADDRAEDFADRMADRGMAALRSGEGLATADPSSSRIRRSASSAPSPGATIGLEGGETDAGLSADIDAARQGGQRIQPGIQAKVQ